MNRRRLVVRLRWYSRRIRRFILHNILHADDPPHRLALGVAIGVFVTCTPTIGFQMALVVFIAWLLRANKVVGLPIVWLSNPATVVPLYYPCYVIGRILLGREKTGRKWWGELWYPPEGWWPMVTFYWSRLLEIAAPLWLGSLIVATVAAIPTYYLVYHLVRIYRLRRFGQLVPPSAVLPPTLAGDLEPLDPPAHPDAPLRPDYPPEAEAGDGDRS